MPRIPIIRLRPTAEQLEPPRLTRYTPTISLEGLQVGVDNLRHDVHLSFKFVDQARLQIARLIVRHGGMDGLLAAEALEKARGSSADSLSKPTGKVQASELKPLLSDFHIEPRQGCRKSLCRHASAVSDYQILPHRAERAICSTVGTRPHDAQGLRRCE